MIMRLIRLPLKARAIFWPNIIRFHQAQVFGLFRPASDSL